MRNVHKIILGIVTISLLLVGLDWSVGSFSEKLYYSSKYGIFRRQIYCLKESKDDVLILGSSRAAHHYVPQIFEDSLGMSCYNAGSDGMCIYYHYAILSSYIRRGSIPKVVVYDVHRSDAEISNKATFSLEAALDRLAPHFGENPEIDGLFAISGWREQVKLLSKTYKFNSKLVQTIKCNYIPSPEDRGYEAFKGILHINKDGNVADVLNDNEDFQIEECKLQYIKKLIRMCKEHNIRLVMCYSPYYHNKIPKAIEVVKEIAKKNDVDFYDYGLNNKFQNKDFFKDKSHLNDRGAHEYTREVVKHLYKF